MTAHLPPPSDEDLSAAIDGEADAEALARIDAHPDHAARSNELRRASDLLGGAQTPELDAATVDRLVGEAVGAAAAPARPAGRRAPAGWMVAAVIAVLVGVGLTLVWTGRDAGEDQASTSASDQVTADEDLATDAESAPASELDGAADTQADAGAAADAGSLPLLELGAFESGDALRQSLASTLLDEAGRQSSTAAVVEAAVIDRCAEQLVVALELPGPPQAQAQAQVDGELVLVYEFAIDSFEDGRPTTLVAAVDAAACAQVVVFER